MATPALESMQAAAPVLGYNLNRVVDALSGLRDGLITITDSNGNTTVSGGSITPAGAGASGSAPSTPTGFTVVSGLDRIAATNNAYLLATWNANPAADYVANYWIDYWNVSVLASPLTSGNAYTALPLTSSNVYSSVPFSINSGQTILLNDQNGHTQTVTTSAVVAAGATSIPVNSFVANFSYPATSTYVQYAHGTVSSAGLTSVKIHNLFPGLGYYLLLTAQNGLGNYSAAATDYVVAMLDTTAPATPTGLTAYAAPHGAFLQWNANTEPDLAGYIAQYSFDNATWVTITSGPNMNTSMGWTNPNAPNSASSNVTVYFRLAAEDFSGNVSPYTTSVTATTGGLSYSELLVGNLTALGTFTGSGGIQTSATGQRLVMNNSGLTAYDTDGVTVTFSLSAIAGSGQFTGTVTGGTIVGSVIETSTSAATTGGFIADSAGIEVVSDGSGAYPVGYTSWFAQTNGNFLAAQYFPTFSGFMPADGSIPATMRFQVVTDIVKIISVKFSFFVDDFKFGMQTVSAGGSSHSHSTPNHSHTLGVYTSTGISASPNTYEFSGGGTSAIIQTDNTLDLSTYSAGGGSTSGAEAAHTHNLNNPSQMVSVAPPAQAINITLFTPTGTQVGTYGPFDLNAGDAQLDIDMTSAVRTATWAPVATGFWQVKISPMYLCAVQGQVNLKATVQAI